MALKKIYRFFLTIILPLLFPGIHLLSQPVSQNFTSNGNYIVPAGYTATVTIEAWGGGGSGGGGNSGSSDRSGGGGGAYAMKIVTLFPGTYAVTVGTGGIAPSSGGAGQNGTASSFTTLVVAAGGTAGSSSTQGGSGGKVSASTGTIRFAGGSGGARSHSGGGGGGGGSAVSSGAGANGSPGVSNTGGSGGTGRGAGGKGGNNNLAGVNGATPGGGGGGKGNRGNRSGNGARGEVNVYVNVVLAVHISMLKATLQESGVQLEWSAFSEDGIDKYQVERSDDGQTFTAIGEIKARNLHTETPYSYTDIAPFQGNIFYRIRCTDLRGNSITSNILKLVSANNRKEISIYPNPVPGETFTILTRGLDKGTYLFRILNMSGQLMMQQPFTQTGSSYSQTVQLPANCKTGIYTLAVFDQKGKVLSENFVVQ